MKEAFENFIVARCEEAKLNDDDYMSCERNNGDPHELQDKAEKLCYLQGLKDARVFFELLGYIPKV